MFKNVLKSFHYLLQGGDGTSAKKSDEDLNIFWASIGGNVDLSKWSKDDFSTFWLLITPIANILQASLWRPIILFRCKGKVFGDHIFRFGVSWCLLKKVKFGPWDLSFFFQNLSSYNINNQWAKFDKNLNAGSISVEWP